MTDIGQEKTDHLLELIEGKLDKLYDQASNEVGEKLNDYMEKHMKKYDAMWDKYEKGEITFDQFQEWASGGMTGKRYTALLDALATDCTNTNQIAMSIVNGYIPEAYALNRNYAFYQLDMNGVDLGATFTLYDRHTVEKLARGKASLLPKPKVDIPKDKRWNRQQIRNSISQGVLQGESIPKIAKRLERVVGMNHTSAVRNARTAMTGSQNAGRVRGYQDAKKMGINVMQEWLATHDGRTRDSHLAIDGERVEVGETFSNDCEYPGDPAGPPEEVYNCRCTLIPYLPDYDVDRRGGDSGDFDEWVEEQEVDERSIINAAIENAQEFSRSEHEEMNFSQDMWDDLSQAERDGVYNYTGSAYDSINSYLRGISSFDSYEEDYYMRMIEGCESALSKSTIAEDTLLYRGMGSKGTLARALGVDRYEVKSMLQDGSLIGQRFVEKGFCSTGIDSGAGWDKQIVLNIVAPKGTEGMYVDPISRHRGEKELLLQRGTVFEIFGVEKLDNEYSEAEYVLNVVVVGLEK